MIWIINFTFLFNICPMIYGYSYELADRPYNLKEEICCNMKFYPNPDGNPDRDCCNGKTYDPRKEKCCEGVVYPMKFEERCCGNTTFNVRTETCCYDEYLDLSIPVEKDKENFFCCNGKSFNHLEDMCCEGKVVASKKQSTCCNGKLLEGGKEVCCWNVTDEFEYVIKSSNPDERCCNGVLYDEKQQLCCNGEKVLDNPTVNLECCGLETFDPNKEVCCILEDGNDLIAVKSRPNDTECCGNITHELGEGVCCYLNNHYKFYKNLSVDEVTCCGLDPFVIGVTELKCCGGQFLYDSTKKTCCVDYESDGDEIATVSDKSLGEECCGLQSYNPEIKECCGKTLTDKEEGWSSCCIRTISEL